MYIIFSFSHNIVLTTSLRAVIKLKHQLDIETLEIHEKQIVLLKVMEVIIATGIMPSKSISPRGQTRLRSMHMSD